MMPDYFGENGSATAGIYPNAVDGLRVTSRKASFSSADEWVLVAFLAVVGGIAEQPRQASQSRHKASLQVEVEVARRSWQAFWVE